MSDDPAQEPTGVSSADSFPEQQMSWPVTDGEIRRVFESMLADGSWGRYHGPHCEQLRMALRDYHQSEHAILCSSGTVAMELALRAVPVQSGDEVILAAYDFKANFINVLAVGAHPVLVDVQPDLPVIDPDEIEKACTAKTKAVIVSHLHGCIAPIRQIRDLAAARGIVVIEDACQNPGAEISDRRAGATGDLGILSFGGSKLLTAGRGGAILTSDSMLAQRIRLYTQRGNEAYPLSEMQAAVLVPQLKQLDERNQLRYSRVRLIESLSEKLACIRCTSLTGEADFSPAFYKLALVLTSDHGSVGRSELCGRARAAGIPLDPAFPALHRIHSARRFRAHSNLDHASALHEKLMTLHHTALVLSEADTIKMMQRLRGLCE